MNLHIKHLTNWIDSQDLKFYLNMNLYNFGLTGVIFSIGYVFLQVRVAQIIDLEGARILFINIKPSGILGGIGIISLAGLLTSAIVQPLAGFVSDKMGSSTHSRLPFIIFGGIGVAITVMFLPIVTTFIGLLAIFVIIQIFGNLSQGPANALVFDNVGEANIGRAYGIMNMIKILGAGICVISALVLTGFYSSQNGNYWLWVTSALLATVITTTAMWTFIKMRTIKKTPYTDNDYSSLYMDRHQTSATAVESENTTRKRGNYLAFVLPVAFMLSGFAAMGRYAQPYLSNVINVENAQHSSIPVILTTLIFAVLGTVPAGVLADKVGKDKVLVIAGSLGALGAILLAINTSLLFILPIAVILGTSIGMLITVIWTIANSIVSKQFVARDLSLINLSSILGGALVYAAGPILDALNEFSEDLGYKILAISVALMFMIATLIIYTLYRPIINSVRMQKQVSAE